MVAKSCRGDGFQGWTGKVSWLDRRNAIPGANYRNPARRQKFMELVRRFAGALQSIGRLRGTRKPFNIWHKKKVKQRAGSHRRATGRAWAVMGRHHVKAVVEPPGIGSREKEITERPAKSGRERGLSWFGRRVRYFSFRPLSVRRKMER